MKLNSTLKLISSIVVVGLAGAFGSLFTTPTIPGWYAGLAKPLLNPPAWVFGPTWTILYLLMGVSLWLVWTSQSGEKSKALWLFAIQLVLNTIWSPIFFGAQSISGALTIIVLLWAAIVLTLKIFTKISRPAAWLLVPYLLWVTFAGYLHFAIWMLN